MEQKKMKVRLQIQDQEIRLEFARIISSLGGFDIYASGESGIADLLILQLVGDRPEEGILQVQQAITSGTALNVFLTSKVIEQEILIEAIRAGVKEFFPQPLKTEDVKRALTKLMEKQPAKEAVKEAAKKQGTIINVIGSKGGIGTTTIAVNLATSLAGIDQGKSVALIDMNLHFGEIPMFLGIDSVFDWVEVAKNIYRLDSSYLLGVMSLDKTGVRVLPSPVHVLDAHLVTSSVVDILLKQLKSMFDFIVIDSGQSLDEISKTVVRLSDSQLIVTLLSLPCLVNVKRLQETFRDLGYPPDESVKILVNRYQKHSSISLEQAEKSLKKTILWSIPNDFQATMSAINTGRPLSDVAPNAEISDSFKEMASHIAGRKEVKKKKSLLSWR